MTTVRVEWNDKKAMRDIAAAIGVGLDAAAFVVERRAVANLNRLGLRNTANARKEYATGREIRSGVLSGKVDFSQLSKARQRLFGVAQTFANLGGTVDPPGGMPRKRTGILAGSITVDRPTPNLRHIGPNASVKYAAIHEFGGPMPGGQPFLIIDGKFIPLKKGSKGMGVTKPYNMPARPYMRPSLIQSKPEMGSAFESAVRKSMQQKGYT
ncbi:MAG: hypothetical protein E6R03_03830 [Hyphomicrobiaceae bacterium]|nr:MAG: hypothetical protein E6R03_03830 [Hyphomicrobiaceae bacterium]